MLVLDVHDEIHCRKCGLIFESIKGFQEHLPTCNEHELTQEELDTLDQRAELLNTPEFFFKKMEEKLDRELVDKYKPDEETD